MMKTLAADQELLHGFPTLSFLHPLWSYILKEILLFYRDALVVYILRWFGSQHLWISRDSAFF